MSLSAAEAAAQVGMSKAGIIKAIRSGKLSAAKNDNGEWQIEPVELFRVYTPVSSKVDDSLHTSTTGLQRENELLRETIDDLRRRLDAEAEERRKLTLILTESQQKRPSWWARLLGSSSR